MAIGYNISREKFFEKFSDVVSNLKLRASWGLVGNDQIGGERYIYLSNIELENGDLGYTTGRDQNISKNGPKYIRYANNDITWEVGSKWNFGIDLGIKNELNITFDIFKEIRNDIFMERQQIPDYWGTNGKDKWMNLATKMYGNLGKVENKGLDFSIDYVKRFNNDFDMSFKEHLRMPITKCLNMTSRISRNIPISHVWDILLTNSFCTLPNVSLSMIPRCNVIRNKTLEAG